jgi:fumarate reductase flavoprotein subunit
MSFLYIPEKWDGEADVIVVGAGTAGLPAAITAADRGAKVTVLEAWSGPASSLAYIVGGTPFAGTDIQKEKGIDDSPEKMYQNAVEVSGGSPDLWRVIVDRELATYEWLKGLGAKSVELWPASRHDAIRIHRWEGHGARVLKILREAAGERGIEMLFRHRAEKLILDPATGRVVGVRVKHEDKALHFGARKGVILATGGFIMNKELVREFGPHYVDCVPVTPPTHMGDGLKMALQVGAATEGIGMAVCPSISVCTETNHTTVMRAQGAICVNRDAKRWADEVGPPYNVTFADLIRQYPDGLHFQIYDNKIREIASSEDYLHVKEYTADTIEELAGTVSLEPEALVKTINNYNSSIDEHGYDTEYGRMYWGGRMGKEPPAKIDTSPFYAIRCKVSLSSLKGGLKINTRSQVVDQFAIGAFVFGIVAGDNAVDEGEN